MQDSHVNDGERLGCHDAERLVGKRVATQHGKGGN